MMMFMYVDLFIGVICSSFCSSFCLGSSRLSDKKSISSFVLCKPRAHQCEVLDLKCFMRFLHSDIG
jgi:hypothetical protein